MFQKICDRNLTTREKFHKSKSQDNSDILVYFQNKKKILFNKIIKYEKDLSGYFNNYKRKSDINISLYEKYKKNYQNFERINSIIREEQKPKEKKLIFDLLNDYYIKKHMTFNKIELKENIFENSPLIEKSYNRLKMDYLLNYDTMKKEMKENEKDNNKINKLYLEIVNKMNDKKVKKDNSDSHLNINLPGIKITRQINNLNAVKFMKKVDTIAKSKIMDTEQYKKDINKTEIKNKLQELDSKAIIEQNLTCKNFIRNSIKDIQKLQQNLQKLESEENNENPINKLAKKAQKGKSLFYIPTLVKSFPELLYDKLNKNQSNISKNAATNDSSSPSSLIRQNEKSVSHRMNKKYNFNKINKNNKTVVRINNNILAKFKDLLKTGKFKSKYIEPIKKIISSKSTKNNNKKNKDNNKDETTLMYNQILDMSTEDRNSIKNGMLMRTFLKEKKNKYLNSVNEKNSKNYYKSLKRIHFQCDNDLRTEKFYGSYNLLKKNKTRDLFNEMKNFQKTLKMNEKLLIKTLLIEK